MSSDDRKSPKDQKRGDDKIKDLDAKKGARNDEQVMGGRATADSAAAKKADLSTRSGL